MLFSANDEENYIYAIGSRKLDTRYVVKALNVAFNGKGGGKPDYAQGKIISNSIDEVKTFIETEVVLLINNTFFYLYFYT